MTFDEKNKSTLMDWLKSNDHTLDDYTETTKRLQQLGPDESELIALQTMIDEAEELLDGISLAQLDENMPIYCKLDALHRAFRKDERLFFRRIRIPFRKEELYDEDVYDDEECTVERLLYELKDDDRWRFFPA